MNAQDEKYDGIVCEKVTGSNSRGVSRLKLRKMYIRMLWNIASPCLRFIEMVNVTGEV